MKRLLTIPLLTLLLPTCSLAATLTFGGPSSTSVGTTISVPVLLTTASGETANAASANISYPAQLLTLVSISKAASIISIWPQDPSFSQSAGTAEFEGVILNPGWSGQAGTIVTLVFQTKVAGSATLSFGDASVLANDGKGTEILSAAPARTVTVSAASAPATQAPAPGTGGPTITSSTHPDQNKWYKATQVQLAWKNPSDTQAVRIGYDKVASGQPTVVYDASVSSKSLTLKDGTWYFHVQVQQNGQWGPVGTFRIRIDTTPPNPIHITFPHGATSADPRPVILFNTSDDTSGVDHYDVAVKGNSLVTVDKNQVTSNPYPLPSQDPGTGSVTVTAYDAAGNTVSDTEQFEITGIEAPKMDPVGNITADDIFQVSGTAQPAARVDVFLKDSDGNTTSQWTRTSGTGAYRVIWQKRLDPGDYSVTAQSTDDKGAKSFIAGPVNFKVMAPPLLSPGKLTLTYQALLGIIAALIAALGFLLWHADRQRRTLRQERLGSKFGHAHAVIHRRFSELKEAVSSEILKLEHAKTKRALSQEEERFVERMKEMLARAERAIEDELDSTI